MGQIGLYREEILELYRNPRNYGSLENPDLDVYEVNQLCGDAVRLQLNFKGEKVSEVKFLGQGCAISIAAASVLTEMIKGKTLKRLSNLKVQDVLDELGINPNPTRLKCATLGLSALKKGIEEVKIKS